MLEPISARTTAVNWVRAQLTHMNVVANNNMANTMTRAPKHTSLLKLAYVPDSPYADERTILGLPNVNLSAEMASLQFTYDANIATITAGRETRIIEASSDDG